MGSPCANCGGRTATGGRTMTPEAGGVPKYEVWDRDGNVIGGPFVSAVAAATFAAGHPRATIHERAFT